MSRGPVEGAADGEPEVQAGDVAEGPTDPGEDPGVDPAAGPPEQDRTELPPDPAGVPDADPSNHRDRDQRATETEDGV